MHATVILFPGSNADAEMVRTLRDVLQVRTSIAWHRDAELPAGTDLCAIPGGFSYGDYLRAGAIARVSPIVAAIRRHAERGGLVLGVCNGFQILTEAGLLPGALTRNAHLRFECRDVHVTPQAEGPFLTGLPRVLRLPIAHAEGRYQASPETLRALEESRSIAFQYCDREGRIGRTPDEAPWTEANPNGSTLSIAGIQGGPRRNVLGLMPHPERMSEDFQGGADGRSLFDAAVRSAAETMAPAEITGDAGGA
ncbi:phosphoribosylformylglycinamidine synthase subunit PurQ [Chondromyces apiculatus]|uniref:Phosphoribosylformylglycinamidine synthase subunit PurQ n=1 Tax=Chondromyces apiculatus DSM 436 TaxID=1192034 RepID=A0A017T574_9BACT|nr:phosphoribosylformylglycinamidine synthase subunit PurQ [Chondromyces apiculatus]EYF04423.1 Phosphoribosylformylglycinamidine synthase, glutamine amidotransferase subunit [Chondromyces apiculatus DSM 436]